MYIELIVISYHANVIHTYLEEQHPTLGHSTIAKRKDKNHTN